MRKVFCETLGLELKLPEKCERIISFSPAVTEALFSMGLGDKIVGVSVYCVRPEEARKKPILGSYANANINKIKELKPDIIFTTTGYQRDFALSLSKNFNVYAIPLPISLSSLIATCVEVGFVAGYYEEARNLERNLLEKISNIKKLKRRIRVYVEIDLGGPVSFGAFSYITNTLEILGAESIFYNEHCEWLIPNFEKVKEENPEVILYEPKMFRPETKDEVIRKLINRGWTNVDAIKHGRVIVTPGPYDFLAHHGPSFVTSVIPWLYDNLSKFE